MEQAGTPKDNGPLELGSLNQDSKGTFGYYGPWSYMEPHTKSQLAPRAREVPKSIVNEAPLEAPVPLELTGAPDQRPMGP